MNQRTIPVVVWLSAAVLASGCAVRGRSAVAKPAGNTTASTPATAESGARAGAVRQVALADYIAQIRELQANARPMLTRTTLTSAEQSDPALKAGLLALVQGPPSEGHRLVASAYGRLGILDAAHAHWSDAVRLNRSDAAAYDGRARIWRDWGFPNLGLTDAHRAVYYAPKSAAARNTLGTLLHALGHRRAARAEFERAIALDDHAAYALNNLCVVLTEDDPDGAASACRRAIALDPRLTVAHANLARAEAAVTAAPGWAQR
jgi:Flp pilus assembly protein TadD